jgi:hypothetical protein
MTTPKLILASGQITRFAPGADGKSNIQVDWPGVSVLVLATSKDPEAAAMELACMPVEFAAACNLIEELNAELDAAHAEITRLKTEGWS